MGSDKGEKRSFDKLRMSGSGDLCVTSNVLNALNAEAQSAHPIECCGLLLGTSSQITAIQPAKNVHPAPQTHFEIDPQILIDAHRHARSGGPQILGYYHSHPNGRAEPSSKDREQAPCDNRIWAIVANGHITFWRDENSGFTPLPYSAIKA